MKILVATEKPFAAAAVNGIRQIVEAAGHELALLEKYTEKLWGRHPKEISADWGSQRVKGLSITAVLKDAIGKIFGGKKKKAVETSLIEEFWYPKYGPGQLWETLADKIEEKGGKMLKKYEKIEKKHL